MEDRSQNYQDNQQNNNQHPVHNPYGENLIQYPLYSQYQDPKNDA